VASLSISGLFTAVHRERFTYRGGVTITGGRPASFAWMLPAAMSLVVGLVLVARTASAADLGTLTVRVRNGSAPIPGAVIVVESSTSLSDAQGIVTFGVSEGEHEILVSRLGFRPASMRANVRAGQETVVVVQLTPLQLPTEVVTVLGSKSGRIVEDQPVRV